MTPAKPLPSDPCALCGNTREWHKNPGASGVHRFTETAYRAGLADGASREKDAEIERLREQTEPFLQNALAIAQNKIRLADLELDRKAVRIQELEQLQAVYEAHDKAHTEAVDDCTHDEKTWVCCGACHCVAIQKREAAEAKVKSLLAHLKTRHGCDMESEDPDYGF